MKAKAERIVFCAALSCVLLSGALLRFAGLSEGLHLHPDEICINRWMRNMRAQAQAHGKYTMDAGRAYPGGFFVLTTLAKSAVEHTVGPLVRKWRFFTRQSDVIGREWPGKCADFGRVCNVWMGLAAVLFAALAARGVTGSRAACLFAAAVMAADAFSVEHAHYLETDVAMLMTLVVASYLIVRSLRDRSAATWLAAAFATGFAAGTKFPQALLVVPLFASLRVPPSCAGRPVPARIPPLLAMAAAGLALVACGFVAATPDALDAREYALSLKRGAAGVYAETALCVGDAFGEPFIREKMNFANMLRFSESLPPGLVVLSAAGLVMAAVRKGWRRYWTVIALYPALYLLYVVFKAPWSRSQEFLPLTPFVAILAALPVAWAWGRRGAAAKAAALAMAAVAIVPAARNGISMASQFGWDDTRRLAARNLAVSYPRDAATIFEQYSNFCDRGVTTGAVRGWHYVRTESPPAGPAGASPRYLMRNKSHLGRGAVHPVTRELYPRFAERTRRLEEDGVRLGAWSALDSPAPRPTFRSPAMELWRIPESLPDRRPVPRELGVPLPRPAVVEDVAAGGGRKALFKGDMRVGGRHALIVDKWPRAIALGGPGDFKGAPVYCIVTTRGQAASVVLEGLGRRRRLDVAPYSCAVAALRRPWWKPRAAAFELLRFHAVPVSVHITYLPCFLQVAFTPSDAAAVLLDSGFPGEALSLLREAGSPAAGSPFWRALAGDRAAGPAARALLATWREAADGARTNGFLFCEEGIPMEIWQDFARIRLTGLGARHDAAKDDVPLARVLPVPGAAQKLVFRTWPAADGGADGGVRIIDAEGPLPPPAPVPGDPSRMELELAPPQFSFLRLRATASGPAPRTLGDADLTWRWQDMLRLRASQLERALERTDGPPGRDAGLQVGRMVAVGSARMDGQWLDMTLVPLRDSLPPLALQWRTRRHGRWKKRGEPVPLPEGAASGPFHVRTLPPGGIAPDRLALSLDARIPYNASPLPVSRKGRRGTQDVMTLEELLEETGD